MDLNVFLSLFIFLFYLYTLEKKSLVYAIVNFILSLAFSLTFYKLFTALPIPLVLSLSVILLSLRNLVNKFLE